MRYAISTFGPLAWASDFPGPNKKLDSRISSTTKVAVPAKNTSQDRASWGSRNVSWALAQVEFVALTWGPLICHS